MGGGGWQERGRGDVREEATGIEPVRVQIDMLCPRTSHPQNIRF
jgi:hypothetical protein